MVVSIVVSVVISLAFAVVLPRYADYVSSTEIPVGAVTAGPASMTPPPGWELLTQANTRSNEVTLVNGDSVVTLRTSPTGIADPQVLLAALIDEQHGFTATAPFFAFDSPSKDPGSAAPVVSSDQMGVFSVITKEDAGYAAEVVGLGPITTDANLSDISAMIESVRLRDPR